MNDIGQRLRKERQRLQMTQQAFGAAGGVETNAQGHYEKGLRSPNVTYMVGLAAKGVDVLYVLTGRVTPQTEDALIPEEAAVLHKYRTLPTSGKDALWRMANTLAEMSGQYSVDGPPKPPPQHPTEPEAGV